MKRRSLSASLGSWCVQLIYSPRRAGDGCARDPREGAVSYSHPDQKTSELGLLLPAFVASWLTVVAGSYALGHYLMMGAFALQLTLLFASAGWVALGAQCFGQPWKRLSEATRWPLVLVLIFLGGATFLSRNSPIEATAGESNTFVAVFLCFITLLSVLLAGAQSGGRIVPLSAPLVPGLALFGLLCLISVDTEMLVCFFVFVAAATYLLSYCRFLRRVRPDLALGSAPFPVKATLPSRREVGLWSKQSFLIAGVWMGLFLGGGSLLYLPVKQVLAALVTPQINRMRQAAQKVLPDEHSSSAALVLQGGARALSDRQVLRVTMYQGTPSGLWRGRIYERYADSQWEENPYPGILSRGTQRVRPHLLFWPVFAHRQQLRPPILGPREGAVRSFLERVEPLSDTLTSTYASGLVVSSSVESEEGGASGTSANAATRAPYLIRSFVVEPSWQSLMAASGYERSTGHIPDYFRGTLELPYDPELLATLSSAVHELNTETRRPPQTPFAKVRAIAGFLALKCTYSLNTPTVPPSTDAVNFFLTESHQGACDLFASSMVLLLRQMNVPARLVTGYIQAEDALASVSTDRPSYVLRERDAHAWVEYYVPKYGWLSYDPTANTRTLDEPLPAQLGKLLNVPLPNVAPQLLLLPAIGLGLIALGAAWRQPRSGAPAFVLSEDEQLRRFIAARYARAVNQLHRRVPHPPHLTPGEYEARVCRANLPTDAKQEFAALTHLYIAARYGCPDPVSREEVDACLTRFETALKAGARGH